jgi:hypothetical protein
LGVISLFRRLAWAMALASWVITPLTATSETCAAAIVPPIPSAMFRTMIPRAPR